MFGLGITELIILVVLPIFIWLTIKAVKRSAKQVKEFDTNLDDKHENELEILSDSEIKFIKDNLIMENDIISGTEEIPLDNINGTEKIVSEHEVSKTVQNTIKISNTKDLHGRIKTNLWTLLETEIKKNITRSTGIEFGETITKTTRVTVIAPPGKSVKYVIEWKQKFREGNALISIGKKQLQVPYETNYGLSHSTKCIETKDE